MQKPVWAIGLMSGTSLDGLDAALIRSNGVDMVECGKSLSLPLAGELQQALRMAVRQEGDIAAIEREFTLRNVELIEKLLDKAGMQPQEISVIGFHGQTISHQPEQGITRQIGDGALLAETIGIDVVNDFRSADMAAGGQGAPLVPLYHAALVQEMDLPLAVLNIGGIANVTWIGEEREKLIAFDTGPGNVLLNEWVLRHCGQEYDEGGEVALAGKADEPVLQKMLSLTFFAKPPPKSLDRHDFDDLLQLLDGMSVEDGAATLAALTAQAVALAQQHFPYPPKQWLVAGGGRHNPAIMQQLQQRLNAVVKPVEAVGWDGDALEAQAFAYLALRSLAGLPLTLPATTGASCEVTGGVFYPASCGGAGKNH